MDSIALVIHGGAGTLRSETATDARSGLQRALERGWSVLQTGGSSLDACEQAIIQLEDELVFDAGSSAYLNRDGRVQLDAALMDGDSLNAGAVGAVERIRNPIHLARHILDHSEHIFLVGAGAEQFAMEHGIELCDPRELITPFELQRWSTEAAKAINAGTVGAVARDSAGNIAAGTSTGGTFYKFPGRLGDSALIGCGCYADNRSAAVSCTGHGESIMRVVMAKAAADHVMSGKTPQAAADLAIQVLGQRTRGSGGLIVMDRQGRWGVSFSTAHMAWAARGVDGVEMVNV